jgi:uncharacterized membrane protein
MEHLHVALPLVAALGAGLMAGIFFAFSAFVMTALSRLPPAAGIAAMCAINVAILNPLFFALFFGTAGLSLLAAIAAFVAWPVPAAFYLLAGGVLYLLGGLVVTMQWNVPLNQALAAADPRSAEGARLSRRYLAVWTAWNHVRTAAALAAAAAFIMALRRAPG